MAIEVDIKTKEPGVYIVSPVGSLDTETSRDLDKAIDPILKTSTKVIILDMKKVSFIASMGLSLIFKTKKTLEQMQGLLMVINLQPKVQKVFELVKAIPGSVFASMEEADTYLDSYLSKLNDEA